MLFSLLIPLVGGIWLDGKLDTAPLFTLTGAVLGMLAATVGVARITIRTFSPLVGEDTELQTVEDGKEEPD
jgi:F0F1-type ATP synthase assembly protein I